ncbi:amidohydrolase family protein [Ponticaulis sp.]|uniref:amidohydrolase family protein n=1 Tax=Ponticaulis sp. TaxID=2020902 RepID=UPI000B741798|nr:amidohydrolase family protein [Ponticaulis sp.]MAJ09821.1 dihydroorotase [Ponticaulis sp.]RPG17155.1 MAG: dihydroorotase [Hyphomonadaceae bacterium TMED125]|tara:strand:- start:6934 stop:8256 length:1323 start_codon:yes stop_codon:yes gene_type:complete
MKQALINARILDPASGLDTVGGIIIEDGYISELGPQVTAATAGTDLVTDCDGKAVAPGLIDMRVKTGEPGSEHRETLETASRSAVSGGITSMVVMPDTDPAIDTPALVDYLKRAGQSHKVLNRIYPAGALTVGLAGEGMTELTLMKDAGAVLFCNADKALTSANLIRRALQYGRGVGAKIMLRPDEPSLSTGSMNASAFAARLGLRGLPANAEWIGLERDLLLAEMTKSDIIVDQVTTGRSLDIANRHREAGNNVIVTAAAHSLFFNELDIGDGSHDPRKAYLTYCKVNPPFRAEEDRLALIEGLKNGSLNVIVSSHDPQPAEDKRLPFDEASFGAAGLETLLSALTTLVAEPHYELDLLTALAAVTCNPADALDLPQGRIAEGAEADLVVFDPETPWKCLRENLSSRSGNSPFDGRLLTGKTVRTMVKGKWVFGPENGN